MTSAVSLINSIFRGRQYQAGEGFGSFQLTVSLVSVASILRGTMRMMRLAMLSDVVPSEKDCLYRAWPEESPQPHLTMKLNLVSIISSVAAGSQDLDRSAVCRKRSL